MLSLPGEAKVSSKAVFNPGVPNYTTLSVNIKELSTEHVYPTALQIKDLAVKVYFQELSGQALESRDLVKGDTE